MGSHIHGQQDEVGRTLTAGSTLPLEGKDVAVLSHTAEFDVSHNVLGGRYEILGLLGAGGAGRVYRARDMELFEVVALKMLRREIADDPSALDRFRREVRLARRVTHRNVARVFDIGEHESERFLTMEFVDGEPLSAVLTYKGALGIARGLEIAQSVCAGLASAHAAGVIHRDLKPDNVLLAHDGRVVVTDFGLALALVADDEAKDTLTSFLGTPAYMAPEQVEGCSDIDARTDIYALGALLYEIFTGARAWPGTAPFLVAAARLTSPPPDPRALRPNLPPALAELILRCMAKNREDRPVSIEAIAEELCSLDLLPDVSSRSGIMSSRPPPPAPDALGLGPRPDDKTVAVLPFTNQGADEDDYLAEELTDDLIDALSMVRGLKVRARMAVQRFRGSAQDARAIGRELEVDVVVEGSVRRMAGGARITARLISVAEGFQLWAKRFDRPAQDVLSINDEAATAIATALTARRDPLERKPPADPAALDLYIRARHAYRKFWRDPMRRAVELFERAEQLAPDDPMILAGHAMALSRLSYFTGDAGVQRALDVAWRAVAVAPNFPEARLALGSVLFQAGEPKLAVSELLRAVRLNPAFAEAQAALGRLLLETGRVEDGMRRLEAAVALDPGVPLGHSTLAPAHALLQRWNEARAIAERERENEGELSFWMTTARMLLWSGRKDLTEEHLRAIPRKGEFAIPQAMLEVVARRTLSDETAACLTVGSAPEGSVRRRLLFLQLDAVIMALLGDKERSLAALERAAEEGLTDLFWLERCAVLDVWRKEPRFVALHEAVSQRARAILDAYEAG